ncbi:hypothetical protein KIPB_004674, partial [Kipferlia bialata]
GALTVQGLYGVSLGMDENTAPFVHTEADIGNADIINDIVSKEHVATPHASWESQLELSFTALKKLFGQPLPEVRLEMPPRIPVFSYHGPMGPNVVSASLSESSTRPQYTFSDFNQVEDAMYVRELYLVDQCYQVIPSNLIPYSHYVNEMVAFVERSPDRLENVMVLSLAHGNAKRGALTYYESRGEHDSLSAGRHSGKDIFGALLPLLTHDKRPHRVTVALAHCYGAKAVKSFCKAYETYERDNELSLSPVEIFGVSLHETLTWQTEGVGNNELYFHSQGHNFLNHYASQCRRRAEVRCLLQETAESETECKELNEKAWNDYAYYGLPMDFGVAARRWLSPDNHSVLPFPDAQPSPTPSLAESAAPRTADEPMGPPIHALKNAVTPWDTLYLFLPSWAFLSARGMAVPRHGVLESAWVSGVRASICCLQQYFDGVALCSTTRRGIRRVMKCIEETRDRPSRSVVCCVGCNSLQIEEVAHTLKDVVSSVTPSIQMLFLNCGEHPQKRLRWYNAHNSQMVLVARPAATSEKEYVYAKKGDGGQYSLGLDLQEATTLLSSAVVRRITLTGLLAGNTRCVIDLGVSELAGTMIGREACGERRVTLIRGGPSFSRPMTQTDVDNERTVNDWHVQEMGGYADLAVERQTEAMVWLRHRQPLDHDVPKIRNLGMDQFNTEKYAK